MNTNLPSFLIVGAAKAGTTSLYNCLDSHPSVYLSPVKEPHHFDIDTVDTSDTTGQVENYMTCQFGESISWSSITKLEDYHRLFSPANHQVVRDESSTPYFYNEVAARRIAEMIPDAKILIMLREPVSRAYSHYQMDLSSANVNVSFVEAVEASLLRPWADWSSQYVRLGLYSEQVKRYLDVFPREQVMIGSFDDFKSDTPAFFDRLSAFLNNEHSKCESKLRACPQPSVSGWILMGKYSCPAIQKYEAFQKQAH